LKSPPQGKGQRGGRRLISIAATTTGVEKGTSPAHKAGYGRRVYRRKVPSRKYGQKTIVGNRKRNRGGPWVRTSNFG